MWTIGCALGKSVRLIQFSIVHFIKRIVVCESVCSKAFYALLRNVCATKWDVCQLLISLLIIFHLYTQDNKTRKTQTQSNEHKKT